MIVMKACCLLTNCHKQMQVSSRKHFVRAFSRVQALVLILSLQKMLSDITHTCDFQDQVGAPAESFLYISLAQLLLVMFYLRTKQKFMEKQQLCFYSLYVLFLFFFFLAILNYLSACTVVLSVFFCFIVFIVEIDVLLIK